MFDLIKRLRFWWTYPRHLPHPASPVFLGTREWKRVRYEALRASDGRCELCGRGKHDGVVLNVDHIVPRVQAPHLALDVRNLQALCGDGPGGGCNEGKGNRFADDWRRPDHPHSKRRKR